MRGVGDVVGLLGFIVAVTALYRTTLKGSDIELFYVSRPDEVDQGASWVDVTPSGERYLRLAFYLQNEGASGGVLESVTVERLDGFASVLRHPTPTRFMLKTGLSTQVANDRAELPMGVQPGEVRTLFLTGPIIFTLTHTERLKPEPETDLAEGLEFAIALRELRGLQAHVRWTYIGKSNVPRVLRRRRDGRRTKTVVADIDPAALHEHFLLHWRRYVDHADPNLSERANRMVCELAGGES
jgi:hypothetical protein